MCRYGIVDPVRKPLGSCSPDFESGGKAKRVDARLDSKIQVRIVARRGGLRRAIIGPRGERTGLLCWDGLGGNAAASGGSQRRATMVTGFTGLRCRTQVHFPGADADAGSGAGSCIGRRHGAGIGVRSGAGLRKRFFFAARTGARYHGGYGDTVARSSHRTWRSHVHAPIRAADFGRTSRVVGALSRSRRSEPPRRTPRSMDPDDPDRFGGRVESHQAPRPAMFASGRCTVDR